MEAVTKRIRPSRKRLNIQNTDDNEYFKWFFVRYLNLADHDPRRIKKSNKDFAKRLDFKDIKFLVKIRDIHKIKKKNPSELVSLLMKIKKNIQSMYQKIIVKKKTC